MKKRVAGIAAAVALSAGLGAGVGGTIVAAADEDPAPRTVDRGTAVAETSSDVAALYRRVSGAVVQVRAADGPAGSSGSGFVIDDDGHVVTNQHVVGTAERVTIAFQDGEEREARVVGRDSSTDIAVVDVEGSVDVTPLRWASVDSVDVGDPVYAVGSPFGLGGTITAGIVSALDREIEAPDGFTIDDAIQTDAALNRGNSGGPLLDESGRVVGVAAQIRSESGGSDGIGYAVPADTARDVANELIADGEVEHAYLGVSLGAEGAARIMNVVPASPAARAGLRQGDVVLEADGEAIQNGDELRAAIDAKEPGDELRLTIRRGGDEREIEVELGSRPASVR